MLPTDGAFVNGYTGRFPEIYGFKRFGRRSKIWPYAVISGKEFISIDGDVMIDSFVLIVAHKPHVIMQHVHIATGVSILGGGELTMREFSGISAGCRIFTGSDDYHGMGLTGPTVREEFRACDRGGVVIGKHAVVGAGSVVLPGANIGDGAVIGAGSVVKGSVEPWAIYAGSVAKKVGERDREKILELENKQLKFDDDELPF